MGASLRDAHMNHAEVRISIGVLAYNEESSIAETIASIGEQSLVKQLPPGWSLEIVCVPNGCKDRTSDVARGALDQLVQAVGVRRGVSVRVVDIQRPSKENAWNEFVHRISDPQSNVLILMDGDVRIVHPDALQSMVTALLSHPDAYVCGARTVKHLQLKADQSLWERISLGATELRSHASSVSAVGGFAGCLYAARASACRRLRLPAILRGEDSFLRAVWSTDFFTTPINQADPSRIINAPDATVLFEAYVSPRQVLKNLRRRAVGLTINSMLYDKLWAEATPAEDAGALLLKWDREDPGWDRSLLKQKIEERGGWIPPGGPFLHWISPSGNLWTWFRRMKGLPLKQKLKRLPVAMIGTCLTLYAYSAANRMIRSGELENLWFTTRTNLGSPAGRTATDESESGSARQKPVESARIGSGVR